MIKELSKLEQQIQKFMPFNEQEEHDKAILLKWFESGSDILTRENEIAHLTASAWVVSPDKKSVLMAYHNIYHSWAWLGGHADGDADLHHVAQKEVMEESGLTHIKVLLDEPFLIEILCVLCIVFFVTLLNLCFVILLSLEAVSEKSLLMCASIVISIVLTDYFMLYLMERFNYLVQKQYEDAMYREEMHYKDIYYEEAEKQNKEVQKLKHDMKHKLHELYHLLENSDGHELSEKIGAMCIEFEQIDEKQYSDNPIVDSVLRIKFGRAKARGIKVETSIRIPKKMQLDHGDIGVLYGNLVDNAVEACSKVPEEQRFVKIENKYQSGILLLIITNSKTGKKNKSLKTTKKDNIRHGHGVQSVRKVVEKYNGTVSFTDKGDIFEVSAMLYGIEVKE